MTGLPDSNISLDANARNFHREQLSAMMDGELSADEAKFLLRRMEHDDALADCWQRWQLVGDALRGEVDRALPADFSRRVGRAIADDLAAAAVGEVHAVAAHGNARGPLLRWGGGAALAASVALAALIGTRMLSPPNPLSSASTASSAVPMVAPMPMLPTQTPPLAAVAPEPLAPRVPDALIAQASAAVVMAAVSSGERRGSRPRILARQEAIAASAVFTASTASTASTAKVLAGASATAYAPSTARGLVQTDPQADSLATQTQIAAKPWPRALVPGASMDGQVTAGFEGSPVMPAFKPRTDPQAAWPVERPASSP